MIGALFGLAACAQDPAVIGNPLSSDLESTSTGDFGNAVLEQSGFSDLTSAIAQANTGDYVTFGHYEQDNNFYFV